MISLDTAATEVFQILRSYDYAVMMYDEDGNQVYEPESARRFFAKPENLLVSLVDNGDNSSIRLYIGKSTEIMDVLGLDQTLRMTATKYNMIFNLKRYGRDLEPADFASKASVTEARRETTMNILEGMYGTTRSSYLKLENARMIVRHSKKIDEMVMGSRGRHIDAIFVENAQGERFLFPTRQLSPARAMTQHVNQGGGFADQVGQQIQRMATDYANLGQASQYIATNATGLQESAMAVRETCRTQMYEMRKCFERLSRAHSPDKWAAFAEAIEEKFNTLNEGNTEATPIDITEVKELLTIEGIDLSESIMTTVAEAMRDCNCEVEEGRQSATEIKEPACKLCHGSGDDATGHTCEACGGSGVDSINVAGKRVSREAFTNFGKGQLEFFQQPSEEMLDPGGKSSGRPRFLNKDAELSFKLGQIIPQVKNDSILNLLSYVADALPERNSPERQKALRAVAMHALRIAGFSLDEGISPNNEVVREFAEWIRGFNTNKILSEREDDEHDEPMDSERHPGDSDPTSNASGDREDAEHGAVDRVLGEFDPQDFLKDCGSDFNWGDSELSGSDLEYDKSYVMRSLAHYLSKKVEDETGFEVDMEHAVADVWDQIEPLLSGAGYQLTEDGFGLHHVKSFGGGDEEGGHDEDSIAPKFKRSDMVLQTNQGVGLKREVTKASSTDPFTGNEVPVDASYIERMRTLAGMPWNR